MAALALIVLTMADVGPELHAQDDDAVTWQTLQIERNDAPGTYITFQPPTTPITPYKIMWPNAGLGNSYVFVGRLAGPDSVVLGTTLSSQYILELVSMGQKNIRRALITLSPGSPVSVPGYIANDFQSGRTSSGQTALGDRSVILGGYGSTATGSRSAIGGGNGNLTNSTNDVIVGGTNNKVNSSDGGIVGGANNLVNANDAVTFGGYGNTANSNASAVLGGYSNLTNANQAFVGGGYDNTNNGDAAVLFGGYQNTTNGTHAIAVGGWKNTVNSTNEAICMGGMNNSINGNHVFLGGGGSNTINSDQCVLFGGVNQSISGNQCVLLGGRQNQILGSQNVILGGQTNSISGSGQMAIGGGYANQTSANYTAVLGGRANAVQSQYSTVIGGYNGTINAQNSLMFSGSGSNSMSVLTAATFTARNVDLVIANNDNTPRVLKFFESYGSTGSYPGANTNYVGFKAPDATDGGNDNQYILPDRIQITLPRSFAIAASPAPTATTATTEWAAGGKAYSVTSVNANGATTNLSAANLSNDQPIKINPNDTPANRRLTLANGATDGFVVTIYIRNATATNGVRIKGTDANLALLGGADVDLDQNDSISLIWDNTSTKWIEIGRSVN